MRPLLLVAAIGAMTLAGLARADDPVPIGEVVADPDAYHFRMVSMRGTVRQVTPLVPYSPGPDTTCYGAYTFMLEDETGSMEISVLGVCGKPFLRKPEVTEGETILLVAQIFSSEQELSTAKGPVKKLRAVANSISHLSPPVAPSEAAMPDHPEETMKPEADTRPDRDSGY